MLPFAAQCWPTHKPRASAAIAIWIVATIYSFTAAVGFAALNRETSVSGRQVQAEINKTLQLMRQSTRWQSSAGCADATAPLSKDFCTTYQATAATLTAIPQDADDLFFRKFALTHRPSPLWRYGLYLKMEENAGLRSPSNEDIGGAQSSLQLWTMIPDLEVS